MTPLAILLLIVAGLFLAGQAYLHWRRRKVARFFEALAPYLGGGRWSRRIVVPVGGTRVVLDAQVTHEDRPEELRLTVPSTLRCPLRITHPIGAPRYDDCRHRDPAPSSQPFAGWHLHSEDTELPSALESGGQTFQPMETLVELGFTRVEFTKGKLRALWPDFRWEPDQHSWSPHEADAIPKRIQNAAEALVHLSSVAERALGSSGHINRIPRARAIFLALFFVPTLLSVAGIAALVSSYPSYPPVRDEEWLTWIVASGVAACSVYTPIAYQLLRKSVDRRVRTLAVSLVSLLGFCLASAALILWWNGTGTQNTASRVTVEVLELRRESAFVGARGALLHKLVGEESTLEEWLTTHRAHVRSWRDDSVLGIELTAEQFEALPAAGGRISMAVSPGALGIEWYSDVRALPNE